MAPPLSKLPVGDFPLIKARLFITVFDDAVSPEYEMKNMRVELPPDIKRVSVAFIRPLIVIAAGMVISVLKTIVALPDTIREGLNWMISPVVAAPILSLKDPGPALLIFVTVRVAAYDMGILDKPIR